MAKNVFAMSYYEVSCPACGGPGVALGSLGRLMHYRCRNCGINFHCEKEDTE
jgi:transposase-like protein